MDVLIVEDDLADADWITGMMTHWRHRAERVASGQEGPRPAGPPLF